MSKFALLFMLLFFGGVVATFAYSGSASFLLYQLVYFLNPDARWWSAQIPGISYSFVASILMIGTLAMGYRRYTEKSPWTAQPALKWLVVLLLFYYLAYVLFALDPVIHKRFTIDFTKLVIIVFVAYKLLNSKRALAASIWAYLIGATYIGYLATITGRNSGDRVEGIGLVDSPDANGVAAALVPAGVLLLYYAWMGNWKVRLLAVICGALIANGLVLINSRGAFLGSVAGVAPFLLSMFFSRYQRRGQRPMALLIAIVGLSGALYVTDAQFWERMNTLQNLESKESGAGRVTFWLKTFDMLEDHPMGMGIYGYNRLAPLYMDDETRGGVEFRSVHSLWFQGLSEVGPLGFLVFLTMLVSLYRTSRKARHWLRAEGGDNRTYFQLLALECALLSYLAAATFINQFRAEILYWMILLLAVGTNVHYLQHVRVSADTPAPRRGRTPVSESTAGTL
ncbi:O-antigen ligase family protein [Marinobacter lutaoensis]|uniref:Polymerase n=1 Tax=Marinobacter lutaoensis TaxID=135739 RepID=A0A1V2DYD8_9GAMM|nr:O-antigen ligase family protein [Marinobacter lutaoensis]NVD36668.1 O-antigen ligase family protein [Marinobacter lutaoensis]ONF45436.1 polymerase [Marinobacter lutaoensis]